MDNVKEVAILISEERNNYDSDHIIALSITNWQIVTENEYKDIRRYASYIFPSYYVTILLRPDPFKTINDILEYAKKDKIKQIETKKLLDLKKETRKKNSLMKIKAEEKAQLASLLRKYGSDLDGIPDSTKHAINKLLNKYPNSIMP
jgi:hypothetical protein